MDGNLAGFVALGALVLGLFAWLRLDIKSLGDNLRAEMGRLEDRVNARFDAVDARFDRLEGRLAAVEHGQAKLEGLLEGLREAIAGRAAAE